MSSTSSDEEFFLIEGLATKLKRKKVGIHPINLERKEYGEYHHLFKELKRDDRRFFQYTRMTQETFTYNFKIIEPLLTKNWCNLHRQPTLPEERLVITLR